MLKRKIWGLMVPMMVCCTGILSSCRDKVNHVEEIPFSTISILESETTVNGESGGTVDFGAIGTEDKNDASSESFVSQVESNKNNIELGKPQKTPEKYEYVRMIDYIPDLVVELRYATEDNFTGEKIYDFEDAYLRYGTVLKLMAVQEELKEQGIGLKVWDAYRPFEAQVRLWEVCPNATYVANPAKGATGHCTGCTVDITLVDATGKELVMPTEFDSFSNLADRDYSDCEEEAKANALLLENVMIAHGFRPYKGEWWDFTDEESYGGDNDFVPPYEEKILREEGKDWVQELQIAEDVSQLMIVTVPNEQSRGATFSLHTKDANGNWREILRSTAIVGKDGIGKAHEGDMLTPRGDFGFLKAFGIQSTPGTRMEYLQVDEDCYWVDDSDSRYYNQFVRSSEVEKDWNSAEHIIAEKGAYDYVLALDYNKECVPMEGSAIFLHVARGNYTAGCIGIPKETMVKVLNHIHSDCRIIIDTEANINLY